MTEESLYANILVEIDRANFYYLKDNKRELIRSCSVKIASLKTDSGDLTFINMGSLHQTISKLMSVFCLVDYETTVAYIFSISYDRLNAISIDKSQGYAVVQFNKILSESATVIPYIQAIVNPSLSGPMEKHCPQVDFVELVEEYSKVTNGINKFGLVSNGALRRFGMWTSEKIESLGGYKTNEVLGQPISRSYTIQAINNIQQSASKLHYKTSNKVSIYVDPLIYKGKNGLRSLGQRFYAIGPKTAYTSKVVKATGNAISQVCHGCFFALKNIGRSSWGQVVGRMNGPAPEGQEAEAPSINEPTTLMEKGLLDKTTPHYN